MKFSQHNMNALYILSNQKQLIIIMSINYSLVIINSEHEFIYFWLSTLQLNIHNMFRLCDTNVCCKYFVLYWNLFLKSSFGLYTVLLECMIQVDILILIMFFWVVWYEWMKPLFFGLCFMQMNVLIKSCLDC